jgi:hypothetical protein
MGKFKYLVIYEIYIRRHIKMQFKTVECDYCHKKIIILEEYIRQPIFCTIGCMGKSKNEEQGHN